MSAIYVVIKCPVCSGAGAVQCKDYIQPCIIPSRLEERCDCCDGKGWIAQGQVASPFCKNEAAR